MDDLARLALVVLVAAVSGVMNAIAGGGTLLTFPALIGLGIPAIVANATSTVALWPAALGSMVGYREQLSGARRWALAFALPSLVGGLVGALLLIRTPPEQFAALVPWLILGATLLFMAQGPLLGTMRRRQARAGAGRVAATTEDSDLTSTYPPFAILVFQFVVAIYGGYFGAGVGILMLAALGLMGLKNIHWMNGLKNWGGLCMNAVAALTFARGHLVNWPVALCMAMGATAGGYGGSRLAQRVGQRGVRLAIIAIGLVSGLWLLVVRF